jgi:hypothetical protein
VVPPQWIVSPLTSVILKWIPCWLRCPAVGALEELESSIEGAETWESARGRLTITYPARSVMLFTYGGHLTADVVPFVDASVHRTLKAGIRPHFFVDLERVGGYDSEYRHAIVRWGRRVETDVEGWFFLVRSRIVAMGVTLSTLRLGAPVKATAKRSEFEAAMQRVLRRRA